jgi:hypothetical protein
VINAPANAVINGKTNPNSAIMVVEFLKAPSTFLKKKPIVLLKLIRSSPKRVRVIMNFPID